MEIEILYGVVVHWDKVGYKIVTCHPSENSSSYIHIIIATMMDLRSLEMEKISITRDRYTIHLLIGELNYACVTRNEGSPVESSCVSFCAQEFLERVRSVYRELPMLIDLSRDIEHFSALNLSAPLEKIMHGKNYQDTTTLPIVKGELAEVRKVLLDSVQKLIDRGEKLDELVRKTRSLEITVRKDFRFPPRLTKKKKSICLAVFASIVMLLSALKFTEDKLGIRDEIISILMEIELRHRNQFVAAQKIQAWFRGIITRCHIRDLNRKATIIQSAWRGYRTRCISSDYNANHISGLLNSYSDDSAEIIQSEHWEYREKSDFEINQWFKSIYLTNQNILENMRRYRKSEIDRMNIIIERESMSWTIYILFRLHHLIGTKNCPGVLAHHGKIIEKMIRCIEFKNYMDNRTQNKRLNPN